MLVGDVSCYDDVVMIVCKIVFVEVVVIECIV